MTALQLALATRYGKYSPAEIHAGVVAALSTVVYVKYRKDSEEVRRHFFDVINKLDDFLFTLNEVRVFNVDQVKLLAYNIFKVRYQHAFHPTVELVYLDRNAVRDVYVDSTSVIPEVALSKMLMEEFQKILKDKYAAEQGGE